MQNQIVWPDYDKSILGIPNSFLKHYGAAATHATLPILDEALAKGCKNVVFIVFDGMGIDMLRANLPPDAFLNRHIAQDILSVYPSTTTAAITAFESGLSPIEHGWLGWSCYFKEIDKCVDLFSNNDRATGRSAAETHMANTHMPYTFIGEKIKAAAPDVTVSRVSPFPQTQTHHASTMSEICTHIRAICRQPGQQFIYAYHPHPDQTMHEHGCCVEPIKQLARHINSEMERLCNTLEDALVIITADHGLIDSVEAKLDDYPAISECLAMMPSVDSRAVSFFVKEGMADIFRTRFNAQFDEDFILLTKEEALSRGIFGVGIPHAKALDFIGDFVALAVGALRIRMNTGPFKPKAMHAGITAQEMIVPLILIEREKRP